MQKTNRESNETNNEERLVVLLNSLSMADLTISKNEDDKFVKARTWDEWYKLATITKTVDRGRGALHYGFQALYDALIEGLVPPKLRREAVTLLGTYTRLARHFLTEVIYTGGIEDVASSEDVHNDRKGSSPLGKLRSEFEKTQGIVSTMTSTGVPYKTKQRFTESKNMNAWHMQQFYYGLFDHLREEGDKTGTYRIPDSVVFCACGAFEPAAAVSGMLSIPIQAIRSSSSRKDTEPKVLSEHQRSLELSIRGKEVIVVDDYTLTAGTLKRVMEAVNIL